MKKKQWFFLIFIIAFLIRLIALNQSLWLDEAISARVVMSYSYLEIVSKFSPYDFHPPLYYLFLKFWTNIFGYKEISLRFPSVIFSLLTAYLIYQIGKNIFNQKTGFWSAVFFLFNPLVVYYSQEARGYMMITFLVTVVLYFFYEIQNSEITLRLGGQNGNLKFKINLILLNLFLILSFLTFYGSIFLIISFWFYWLFKKQYRFLFFSFLFFFFSFLMVFPIFSQQILNAKISFGLVKNWLKVLGGPTVKNLLLIPLKFSFGRISFFPKWLYWLISGAWTVFIWWEIIKIQNLKIKNHVWDAMRKIVTGQNDSERFKINFFLYLLFFPIFLGFIFSFFTPLLAYFRFLYLLPIFSILLAIDKKQSLFNIKKIIISFGFLVLSLIYLLNPNFHREDWKNLAKSLPEKTPTYMIISSSDGLTYYKKNLKINELRNLSEEKLQGREIIVIPYAVEIYGFDYQRILKEKGMKLKEKKTFNGLILEKYKKEEKKGRSFKETCPYLSTVFI